MTDILVITGLSGAGRSQAADSLEDMGWFVVDNLPTSLLEKFVELAGAPGSRIERVAFVVGPGAQQAAFVDSLDAVRKAGHQVRILFLEASTPELVRRYTSTRRRHPLADAAPSVVDAIEVERQQFAPVKERADLVIDTTTLNVHELKAELAARFERDARTGLQTTLTSFGFKHGLPLDVDMVFDCRFLPNPYWVDELRPHTGLDADVRDYVLGREETGRFVAQVTDLLDSLLPAFEREGKSYLTVAFGCTGGHHRSVAIAEEVARRLRERGHGLRVQHRDVQH